jgi:hypothetical protein
MPGVVCFEHEIRQPYRWRNSPARNQAFAGLPVLLDGQRDAL